jgi:histidine triad (HIT) family protein
MVSQPDCLFCRIVSGDEPAEYLVERDDIVVFKDKFPRAPVHYLVVPTDHLDSAHDLDTSHRDLLAECFALARQVATDSGIADGYRVVTNVGKGGGQAIPHLHFHVLGGKQLGSVDGT